jgi:hypothetical protein
MVYGFYDLAPNENNCFHPVVIPFIFNSLGVKLCGIVIKATVKTKIKFGLIFVIRTENKSK